MGRSKTKIFVVASLKGGVGKTTLAANLLLQLKAMGHKVLGVDLDPSNNLTDYFLRTSDDQDLMSKNVMHAFENGRAISEVIHATDSGIDMLPSTPDLHDLSNMVTGGNPGPYLNFAEKLADAKYDFIVIDTAPYRGPDFWAGLWAAASTGGLILSPIDAKRWVFQGLAKLEDSLDDIAMVIKKKPRVILVPSRVGSGRSDNLKLDVIGEEHHVTKTRIKQMSSIVSAVEKGQTIKAGSQAWDSFEAVTKELVEWAGKKQTKK